MERDVERVARAIFNASMKSVGRTVLWTDDASWPEERIRDEARQCARAAIAAMQEVDEDGMCLECGRSRIPTGTGSDLRNCACPE